MFKSINLKNDNVFRDGVKIDELSKINFIYGSNGSGKTTISNFINKYPQNKDNDNFIEYDEQGSNNDILVYNMSFRKDNFQSSNIKGIFTLGKENIDAENEIKNYEIDITALTINKAKNEGSLANYKKSLENNENNITNELWDFVYRNNENDFSYIFEGYRRSKTSMKDMLLNFFIENNNIININKSDRNNLTQRYNTLYNSNLEKLTTFNEIDDEQIKLIESDAILCKTIVGSSDINISKLITELNSSDWVAKGRTFLNDTKNICPFCQEETISDSFKKQLEKFFDNNYNDDCSKVEYLYEEYVKHTQYISGTLKAINFSNYNIDNAIETFNHFEQFNKTISKIFEKNIQSIDNKKREKSIKIELEKTINVISEMNDIIKAVNDKVIRYNSLIDNKESEKRLLQKEVLCFLLKPENEKIKKIFSQKNNYETAIKNLESKIEEIISVISVTQDKIKKIRLSLTNIKGVAERINSRLLSIGFTNFKLQESGDDKYQIVRNNGTTVEDTLSEGEQTFITFLYFLELLNGSIQKNYQSKNKILVIDDPISSLDSSVMYAVTIFMKDVFKKIKDDSNSVSQCTVLTHNIYFHSNISYTNNRNEPSYHFYTLNKDVNVSTIKNFKTKNPIKNNYQLLWKTVIDAKNNSNSYDCVSLANCMRRIIEFYFGFTAKIIDDKIISEVQNIDEQKILSSLIAYMQDGSHNITDDFEYNNMQDAAQYLTVFEKFFNLTGHIEHYNNMMKIDKT